MDSIGLPWHAEQDLPSLPSTLFQASIALSTNIIPGLSKSSICNAWVSVVRKVQPERMSGSAPFRCAGAAVRVTISISPFTTSLAFSSAPALVATTQAAAANAHRAFRLLVLVMRAILPAAAVHPTLMVFDSS